MKLIWRGTALGLASIVAGTLAGTTARAATFSFQLAGSCQLACNAGTQLSGTMTFDQTGGPDAQVTSSQFASLRYSVDGGASVESTYRYASGLWGSTPGTFQNLLFNTGTTVLPALGPLTQATLSPQADGSLAGILIFSGKGACETAACDLVQASVFESNFNVQATRLVSEPSPVPVPPSLGLALAGAATLAGIAVRRRRRPSRPASPARCPSR